MELEEYLEKLSDCPDEDLSDKSRLRSRLQVEFGIYDNWPILLGESKEIVLRDYSPLEMRLGAPFCLYDRILGYLGSDNISKRYVCKSQNVQFSWRESKKKNAKSINLKFETDFSSHYAKDIRRIVSELARGLPPKVDIDPHITTVFYYVPGVVIIQVMNSVRSEVTYDGQNGPHRKRQLANFDVAFLLHPYNDNSKYPYHMRHRMMAKVIDEIGTYAIERGLPLCFPHSMPMKDEEEKDFSRIVYFNS